MSEMSISQQRTTLQKSNLNEVVNKLPPFCVPRISFRHLRTALGFVYVYGTFKLSQGLAGLSVGPQSRAKPPWLRLGLRLRTTKSISGDLSDHLRNIEGTETKT